MDLPLIAMKHTESLFLGIYNVCQFIALCLYAGHPLYIANCIKPMFALFCFPFGCILVIRCFVQFKVQ